MGHRSGGRRRSAPRSPRAGRVPRCAREGRGGRRTPRPPRPRRRARRCRRRRPGDRRGRRRACGSPPRAPSAPRGASHGAARASAQLERRRSRGRAPPRARSTARARAPAASRRARPGTRTPSSTAMSRGPPPSRGWRYACRSCQRSRATGAGASPSGLITSVVNPCASFGVRNGSSNEISPECVCMSMKPGQSQSPRPSTTDRAAGGDLILVTDRDKVDRISRDADVADEGRCVSRVDGRSGDEEIEHGPTLPGGDDGSTRR